MSETNTSTRRHQRVTPLGEKPRQGKGIAVLDHAQHPVSPLSSTAT